MEFAILSIVAFAFAGGFAALVYFWQKARGEAGKANAQLEQLQQSVKMAQDSLDLRLKEKEAADPQDAERRPFQAELRVARRRDKAPARAA